jgi:hypothetical protein
MALPIRAGLTRRAVAKAALAVPFTACAPALLRGVEDGFLLRGGAIYTGLAARPRVELVVVRGGRIEFAGTEAEIGSGTRGLRTVDLKGAAAFPGFVDAHCHLTGIGLRELTLDLTDTASIAALQETLRVYASAHKQGPIIGRGWIETHWPERRFPTRADIDPIVSDRPVFLSRADGHAALVNSNALVLAGITGETQDPAGGRIERDPAGAATGILIDNVMAMVEDRLPAPSHALKREAVARAVALYASRGWTGIANMSATLEEVEALSAMAAHGRLPLRTDHYLRPEDAGEALTKGPSADETGLVRVRGIKLYMDGALGSRGAALLAPYADAPGDGLLVTPKETIRDALSRARTAGAQVAMHAIGDRGNRLALDAFEAAFRGAPGEALRAARWRIEHAQVLSLTDLPRFGRLGIIASMQPSHAISDLYFAPARLGPDRLRGAYAWTSLLDSGAVIAAGSDAPVEKGDPLIEFYAAVYRHALNGYSGPGWHLEEAVTRAQALRMLTWAPAFAAFAEHERGTIEGGKRADITAFATDLMTCAPSEIPAARAVLTIVDGRTVFSRV